MKISISKVTTPDEHGQRHCRLRIDGGKADHFCIDPDDPHGLSPIIREMIENGKKVRRIENAQS